MVVSVTPSLYLLSLLSCLSYSLAAPQAQPGPASHYTLVAIPPWPTIVEIKTITPSPGVPPAPTRAPHGPLPVVGPAPTTSFTRVAIPDAPAIVEIFTTVLPAVQDGSPEVLPRRGTSTPPPLPYPRENTPESCPRRPGNDDFNITGEHPNLNTLAEPAVLGNFLLDAVNVVTEFPNAELDAATFNTSAPVPAARRLCRRGNRSLLPRGELACRVIAQTNFTNAAGAGARTATSSAIQLYPHIRYGFAFTADQNLQALGIMHDNSNDQVDQYIWTWAPPASAAATMSGVIQFAFNEPQPSWNVEDPLTVKFVVALEVAGAVGEVAVFHMGP